MAKSKRKNLPSVVQGFLIDLVVNGHATSVSFTPPKQKSKVMWVVVNDKNEITAIKPLRRLAQLVADCNKKNETVHRVRLFFEEKP